MKGGSEYPTITVISNGFNGSRAINIALEAVRQLRENYGIYTLIDIVNEAIIGNQSLVFSFNSRIIVGNKIFDIHEDEMPAYSDGNIDETVYSIIDAVISYMYNNKGKYDYDEWSLLKSGNRDSPGLGEVAILE